MISVKEAVDASKKYAKEIFADSRLKDLRVEEVEFEEYQQKWLITLGWVETAVREGAFNVLASAYGISQEVLPRVYKVFSVDATTGNVKSMKIRD